MNLAFPNKVLLTASSTFAITGGCLANCAGPEPARRPLRAFHRTTVGRCPRCSICRSEGHAGPGRRRASGPPTSPPAPGPDGRERWPASRSRHHPGPILPSGKAFFESSVTVTLTVLVTPKPTATCLYVPNMLGMSMAEGRAAWTAARYTTALVPTSGQDVQIINAQVTVPNSNPGDCLEPDATVDVGYVAPPPPPPLFPCRVPSLVNTSSTTATGTWTGEGFTGALTFKNSNQLPYTIKKQGLVGGTYSPCSSTMEVSK